ncbi:MAG: fibronectin type III domain-containing protein, partial [Desulfobacterales bacterium]
MSNSPIRFKVCFKFIALLNFFILLTTSGASAVDVTIAWDANSESDLAGYILFYGTASRSYSNSIDVGNNTEYTLTGLNEGTTYYFSAKAYDTSNNESDYSKELVYTLPGANSAPNTPVQPTGPTSGFIQISYSFDTSGTDPDGDLLTYRFDWGDGNISAWGGAYSRTHAFSSVGTYCIKAQSQDTHSAVSAWSQCLNVDIDIQRHTISASAGPNGSISPSGSVTVNNGADQSFSIIPIQNYHVADVVVDGSSVGSVTSYTFNNVDGDHSIIASFTMDNQPPVANAGADKAVLVNDTVQLDGSNSSDANGDSLTYNWSFVSRPGGSNATLSNTQAVKPTFDVDVAGTYTVRLIVNDGTVDSAPDTVTISTENSKPVSNAGADQTVLVNDTVQLDGSSSSDVDGDSLTYKWSLVAKPGSSNAALSNTTVVKPTIDVDVAGSYTVQLIVNDGTVDSAPDTVMISTENSAPVAQAGADQAVQVNDTVQLDGSGSSDVDGHRLTFNWSLVTKPGGSAAALANPTAVKPTFNVDVTGTYTVQLIVNDGTVDSAPDTVTISTENSAPVANAGADQAVLVNDTVQLDGSGSSDADGDTLTLKWSFVSKPGGSSATMSDTTAVKPTFEVDVAGTYAVQLIVNDGTVDSAPDTVTISTENSAPVANAGADQTVLVNDTVQLDGSGSSDADGDTLTLKWS